ncbi:unnamed protein product [Ectocarpus sp. 4 AP-2014]
MVPPRPPAPLFLAKWRLLWAPVSAAHHVLLFSLWRPPPPPPVVSKDAEKGLTALCSSGDLHVDPLLPPAKATEEDAERATRKGEGLPSAANPSPLRGGPLPLALGRSPAAAAPGGSPEKTLDRALPPLAVPPPVLELADASSAVLSAPWFEVRAPQSVLAAMPPLRPMPQDPHLDTPPWVDDDDDDGDAAADNSVVPTERCDTFEPTGPRCCCCCCCCCALLAPLVALRPPSDPTSTSPLP